MRIAIFQVDFALQSYTRDLINGLVELGFLVDLLTTSNSEGCFIDVKSIKGQVVFLQLGGVLGLYYRSVRGKLARSFNLSISINPWLVRLDALRFFKKAAPYDLFIGIEKAGLELATTCSRLSNTPVIYYSLELYIEDHPHYQKFSWLRNSEIACHKKAVGTIVQDKFRWKSLRTANQLNNNNVFFLPVGTRPVKNISNSTPRSNKQYAFSDKVIVLYFGIIDKARFSYELILKANILPKGVMLYLHGPIYDQNLKEDIKKSLPRNVTVSTELLPETALLDLVSSAKIGLALYRTDSDNDRLTAYSSQKIAIYFQAGLPIIAFRTDVYEDLFGRFQCGEMIESIDDLGNAVERIMNNYQVYSEGARNAYSIIYDLDRYWDFLGIFLKNNLGENLK